MSKDGERKLLKLDVVMQTKSVNSIDSHLRPGEMFH